ncbi:hypothetical protein FHR84_003950 [Actinopolyspora biskrensis]|uniref:Uncharacterized protein n=1 Tax=Actinopolyspora biskrensis TaxID=1470178 RepID=A0A852YZW9_9ACTN|nr:hypothetical protein [Actinopolyspora biskrensis]
MRSEGPAWSAPRVFADESEGFFDDAIAYRNGR